MKRSFQLARSVLVVTWKLISFHRQDVLFHLWNLSFRLGRILLHPKLTAEERSLWRKRMRSCLKCAMFNRRYLTCGTPGETYPSPFGDPQTLGCWCIMVWKAATKSNCWAFEKGLDMGWPKELNNE